MKLQNKSSPLFQRTTKVHRFQIAPDGCSPITELEMKYFRKKEKLRRSQETQKSNLQTSKLFARTVAAIISLANKHGSTKAM